ncbi:MAG TPA: MFS transporter [Minicystis sp.]|nr:MFS transporter [Minicystis sp.]
MPPPRKLPRNVVALGWVSLLTDAASDMIYPLLPVFLMQLGGGAVALGWIEGVAEAVSAAVKLFAGRLSDRAAHKKPLVAIGYAVAALTRPLYAIAATPAHAVAVRALDRVGKGLRGPPRDAIVANAVEAEARGHAFGFHRMMDNFGGVVGPVLAFLMLHFAHAPLRTVFAASVVPGLLSVVVVLIAVREHAAPKADAPKPDAPHAPKPAHVWTPRVIAYFGAVALFGLAASGDLFLMRRLTDLGLDTALVPFAWMSLQLVKGALNVSGGKASDRYGRKRVLVLAWFVYAVAYGLLALVGSWPVAWLVLFVYAVHYGLGEGGQRALVAEIVPEAARGRAFGVQLAVEGLAVLPANVGFGLVYDRFGGSVAFLAGGAVAFAGALALAAVPIGGRARGALG